MTNKKTYETPELEVILADGEMLTDVLVQSKDEIIWGSDVIFPD